MSMHIDWSNVDWSKSSRQIAEYLGCRYWTVAQERRKRGIPPTRAHESETYYFDWENVDWMKPNATIARELGCSRWAVTLARRRMTNTKAFHGEISTTEGEILVKRENIWEDVDWNLSNQEIADLLGVSTITVGHRRPSGNRSSRPELLKYESFDWGKSDTQLHQETGMSKQVIGKMRRKFTNTYSRMGYVYFNDGTPWGDKEV